MNVLEAIPQKAPRADDWNEQLPELIALARKLGMDAAAAAVAELLEAKQRSICYAQGMRCNYHSSRGMVLQAEVLGFTPKGRVKLKVFDDVSDEWFRVTVNVSRLSSILHEA